MDQIFLSVCCPCYALCNQLFRDFQSKTANACLGSTMKSFYNSINMFQAKVRNVFALIHNLSFLIMTWIS